MKNYQERKFSRTKGDVHDCKDAGGRAPKVGDVGAVAEGGTS